MNLDFNQLNQNGQFDQVLAMLPYPLDKKSAIENARNAGANPQIVSVMEKVLPAGTFKSASDIKNIMQNKQTKM